MSRGIEQSPVLTVDEAAKLLRISRGLAFEAARTGELPVIKIGRRMLVSWERLEEMLRTAGQPGGAKTGDPEAQPARVASR